MIDYLLAQLMIETCQVVRRANMRLLSLEDLIKYLQREIRGHVKLQ